MPEPTTPRWQQNPPVENQGPSAMATSPMPGFDSFDPDAPEEEPPRWQQNLPVRDSIHTTFAESRRSDLELFGRGANVGIAEALGAPVDLSNFLLSQVGLGSEEPVGGSKSIQRLFSFLDLTPAPEEPDPDTLAGSAGRLTGAGATLLLPFGAATRVTSQVARNLRPPPKTVAGRVMHQIAEDALRRPKRFIAAEVAAGATAGTGGFIARELFPESEAASVIGELTGAVTPAAVITGVKLTAMMLGAKVVRAMARTVTPTGGRTRAKERFEAVSRDPKQAVAELGGEDVLEGAALTPAQRTGDEGLLSLEKSVIESSEQLKAQADEQITQATVVIRQAIADLGEGVPVQRTVDTMEKARTYINFLLDTRLRVAARQADERIADLAPGASRREANLIAKEEIEKALEEANFQLGELFDAVPLEVVVSAKGSRDFLTKLVKKTPLAQREDIPTVAARLLGRDEQVPEGFEEAFAAFGLASTRFTDRVPVAELQGLRSKLLETARTARSEGQFNRARIADEIAEAVLKDMGAEVDAVTGPAGAQLRLALDFAKDVKNRFNKGPVRRLLKPDPRGGETVATALTLEQTVGVGGPRARVEAEALVKAVERTGDVPALRGAVEDFLLDDFQRRAIRGGKINPALAETFMARNQDILEDFPELASRLDDAIRAGDASLAAQKKAAGVARRLGDPKVSRAAVFLKEPAQDGIKRAAKLPESEAGAVMVELVKEVRRDPTGDALRGLKTAFGDFLLEKTSSTITTTAGDFTVYGSVLKRLLEKPGSTKRMATELFDADELQRLDVIVETAVKVEKGIKAKARPEGVIADAPSRVFSTLAGVLGAWTGRQLKTGTIQAPGRMASFFEAMLKKGTQDPARRLLTDAQQDEALFSALLHPPKDTPAIAQRQLNAWMATVARDSLEGIETEPSEGALATTGEPELALEAPGELEEALEAPEEPELALEAPGEPEEALEALEEQPELALEAPEDAVTDDVVDALAQVESGGDAAAVGAAGELGQFQIIPATAEDPGFGIKPLKNLKTATEAEQKAFVNDYLRVALERFGTLELALASYNAGIPTVDRIKGDITKLPKSTQQYLDKYRAAGVLASESTP